MVFVQCNWNSAYMTVGLDELHGFTVIFAFQSVAKLMQPTGFIQRDVGMKLLIVKQIKRLT